MKYEIYWDRVAILVGFVALGGLFGWGFFFNGELTEFGDSNLVGYVILEQGVRVSTEKMDAALVQEIQNGETQPRVIVVLEEPGFQEQEEFLENLAEEVDILDVSHTEVSPEVVEQHHQEELSRESDNAAEFIVTQKSEAQAFIAGEIKDPITLVELTKSENVAKIVLDYPVELTLDESAPMIGINTLLNFSTNLTRHGEMRSVCVIDTGIDYTHAALGSCSPVAYQLDGNTVNGSGIIESEHPYNDSLEKVWQVTMPGFDRIAIHFSNITLEPIENGVDTLDRIYVYDGLNQTVAIYKSTARDIWTPSVEGDTIYVKLISDSSVTGYGFYVDQAINGTTQTTMNWSNCSLVRGGWDTFNNDVNPIDDHGHGTHVAGIIASQDATYKGISPYSSLVAVKALDSQGSGYASDVLAGLEWCTSNAQRYNISAISMSLGCGGQSCVHYQTYCNNDVLASSINKAVGRNISVFIAAGNNGWSDGISNPSCIQNVTPVGGVNANNEMVFNRGTILDVVAPATQIMSTSLNGAWASLSGTSMATPHAAAVSVVLRDFYQKAYGITLLPDQLEALLATKGKSIIDSASSRTYHRLDVRNATKPTVEWISPSPVNSSTLVSSSVIFNVSSDVPFAVVTLEQLSLNQSYPNMTYNSTGNNNTHYWYSFTLTNISEGLRQFHFYGIDLLNQTSISEQREVWVNLSIIPLVVHVPENNSYHRQNVSLEINVTDVADLKYYVFNQSRNIVLNYTNGSMARGMLRTSFGPLGEGNYTLLINASDSEGNQIGLDEKTFKVDTMLPQITVTSLLTANKNNAFSVTFVVNETNLNTSSLRFHTNITGNWSNNTVIEAQGYTFNASQLQQEKRVYYEIFATDLAKNSNSTGLLYVDVVSPASLILSPANATVIELGSLLSYSSQVNLTGNYTTTWSFGEGIISANGSGSYEYQKTGRYDLLLNASNGSTSLSDRRVVIVNDTTHPTLGETKYLAEVHLQRDVVQLIEVNARDNSGISTISFALDGNLQNGAGCSTLNKAMSCTLQLSDLRSGAHVLNISVVDNAVVPHTLTSSYSFNVISCTDTIQNGNEAGVDCGGSCSNSCVSLEAQKSDQAQPTLTATNDAAAATPTTQTQARPVNWTGDLKEENLSSKQIVLMIVWGVIAILSLVYAIFVRRK
ncbi:S8 family serine peptidase [Candidatus Woesearchaeota archaeon]|nr:S8 family serine peptidase [Candidatus Woesearchaeota archaeon]